MNHATKEEQQARVQAFEAQAAREPTIQQYMDRNPQAPLCSRCGERVAHCSKEAVAAVCWECTARLAELAKYRKADLAVTRKCPGCGGPIAPRKRFCGSCAKARRRLQTRDHARQHRQKLKSGGPT